jgi:hypothetical protein
MASQHERLERALSDLQSQLSEMRKLDPRLAQSLDATLAEARAAVRGQAAVATGRPATSHPSIVDRLRNEVLQYEASHPSLAASLGSIIDALAGMGI